MPNPLLDRYLRGEQCQVWQDLLSLGAAVRDPEHFENTVGVARETMKRARHNVEALILKLERLGYEFTDAEPERPKMAKPPKMAMVEGQVMPRETLLEQAGVIAERFGQPGFVPSNDFERRMAAKARQFQTLLQARAEQRQRLLQMESAKAAAVNAKRQANSEHRQRNAANGTLNNPDVWTPPRPNESQLLDEFERRIGGPLPVSLRHWYEQVGAVSFQGVHEALSPIGGKVAADPLMIEPYFKVLDAFYGDEEDEEGGEDFYDLPLAPDAIHKAHESGGDPYSMAVPNASADGLFNWDTPDTYFVDYLRVAFAWGGFPGWQGQPNAPAKEIAHLTKDLLAI